MVYCCITLIARTLFGAGVSAVPTVLPGLPYTEPSEIDIDAKSAKSGETFRCDTY